MAGLLRTRFNLLTLVLPRSQELDVKFTKIFFGSVYGGCCVIDAQTKLRVRLKVVVAMSRYDQLQVDLEHCRKRVQYAERQLEDYTLAADLSTELAARTLRKLADDLKRAHDDTRWLQKELDDLMD